ncbi:MAG: hypothetical protein ACFCU9_04195 [Cyanophyceae cyanobacterium]
MNSISTWLSNLRPMQILLSTLLLFTLVSASGFPALAARSGPNPRNGANANNGTVHLDEIQDRTQEAVEKPELSLNPLDKLPEDGLNEVQGTADRDKMLNNSNS